MEIEVRQRAPIARLTLPDDSRLVTPGPTDVAIHTINTGVQRSADEPFRMGRVPLENLRPFREPLQFAGKARPVRLGVAFGPSVDIFVTHVGLRSKCRRRCKGAVFLQQVSDFSGRRVLGHSVTEYNAGSVEGLNAGSKEQDPVYKGGSGGG